MALRIGDVIQMWILDVLDRLVYKSGHVTDTRNNLWKLAPCGNSQLCTGPFGHNCVHMNTLISIITAGQAVTLVE